MHCCGNHHNGHHQHQSRQTPAGEHEEKKASSWDALLHWGCWIMMGGLIIWALAKVFF